MLVMLSTIPPEFSVREHCEPDEHLIGGLFKVYSDIKELIQQAIQMTPSVAQPSVFILSPTSPLRLLTSGAPLAKTVVVDG